MGSTKGGEVHAPAANMADDIGVGAALLTAGQVQVVTLTLTLTGRPTLCGMHKACSWYSRLCAKGTGPVEDTLGH